ncbi:hypothetical protein ACFWZ1_14975 [Frateuria sp. GZRe14]|uniref:hypothetical protein n=1 Tax=Frateuria sp. GZRe14 TaxID=3351534 RepID=UPI003EDC4C12
MRTYLFVGVALLAALCVGTAWVLGTGVVVHVAGPAVPPLSKQGERSSRGASSMFRYPAKVSGLGESGLHVVTEEVAPDHVVDAWGGQLLGSDRGEWGGELVFRDAKGTIHPLLKHNVQGIVPMPFGMVVFTGLAHMGQSAGAIYRVIRRADGSVAPELLHQLRGAPGSIEWTARGDLVFKVDVEAEHLHRWMSDRSTECQLLDRYGALHRQWCVAIR